MANARVFLPDLKSGRCSEVRLLRFWEARNIKRGDELMSVDMLLLDSNVTSSQQTLTFSRPYITGELTAVKSHVNDRPKDKIRVMATIKIDSDVSLALSVFPLSSCVISQKLESFRVDTRVFVATNYNLKIVGGTRYDKETDARESYFYKNVLLHDLSHTLSRDTHYYYSFFTNDTGNISAASLLRGFAKVEPMKIAELNQFIITPQPQSIKFICTGKVTVSSQKKDGATSWTLEITCLGSVSLSAKMFGGGNEKENNSGSKTSTGLILKKAQTTSAKVKSMLELVTLIRV
ncbi:hypothetical protein IGI04_019138 [Brassica rapa subsp. trilocularis]|nr:hypothetical protein IGI04_031071 [Brassica rapa subsp. trilocularis]KAG5397324.1 hypothetical protein IGI04_019138 [Brassica rapa subsp. trilocularis]